MVRGPLHLHLWLRLKTRL
ncbi:hypothetical protein Goari_027013 [Gossypium aridum]|uniref:Uncharacterized protein n=1 Tax=Gossypium aridum TaxID=34290 RepID=A0A7J8YLL7_GOSAI|nr:hypothetical protein [Gossypium aridum]